MRSLVVKLTLAFLVVSLAGIMLVAVLTRQATVAEFDRFVKLAAAALASKAICASLGIKTEEEHFRFGFAA